MSLNTIALKNLVLELVEFLECAIPAYPNNFLEFYKTSAKIKFNSFEGTLTVHKISNSLYYHLSTSAGIGIAAYTNMNSYDSDSVLYGTQISPTNLTINGLKGMRMSRDYPEIIGKDEYFNKSLESELPEYDMYVASMEISREIPCNFSAYVYVHADFTKVKI